MNIKEQLTLPSLRHRIRSALGVLDFRCSCENKQKNRGEFVSFAALCLSLHKFHFNIRCTYCMLLWINVCLERTSKVNTFLSPYIQENTLLTFCLILLGRVTLSLNYSFRSLVLSFGSLRSRFLSQILLSTFTVPNHNNMDKTSLRC